MRVRRYLIIFLLVLLPALLLWWFQDAISAEIKAWRYQQTIDEARAALEQEKHEEVTRLTGAALRLSSGRLPEIRELFELASAARSSDSLGLGESLFVHPEATLDDRLAAVTFVFELGEWFYLDGLLGRLTQAELREPRIVAIRAAEMIRKGDRIGALLLLDSLSEDQMRLTTLRTLKGRLMAAERGNPLAWQDCRKILGDIMAKGQEAEALAAFRALFLLPDQALREWDSPDLWAWLKEQKGSEPRDHLAAAHWKLLRQPDSEEVVMQEVLTLADQAPEDVARWVLEHRKDKVILEREIDLNSADSYPFYLARLQYFLNQESWPEARDLLKNPHRSMKDSLHAGFQAAVALRLGDEVSHVFHLQEALEKARRSEDFGEFLALVKIGERLNDQPLKRKACEGLVALPARFLPGGDQLIFLEFEFGSEPAFLADLYQKLSASKPDDPVVTYHKALIDHVISRKSDDALKALDYLLKDYSAAASLRSAKALVLARDSLEEAFAVLQNDKGEMISLEGAFERAIYQYLLRLRGEEEQAQRYLRGIEWSALPPYLRDFLKPQQPSTVSEP